ncbi:hypothetical protein [Oscillatoria sp. FACHB-1406]|uniref:hypothetical protein n=1 Tax=Oscillatoria sp. FACHB-1406 TaxID=2692846 RepID=UPI001681D782|nr:hypothetical protein [Oscillatoria sp. FACHB-1406]MBD2580077.1 hypothetical protein [Oscillatoria sp. FACHB-1406]
MKPWEFLIQKKGSPAWLALKTQKLKLETGEYRLVARSHQPNLDVEVLVTYQTLDKALAQPRSQKRTTRTNSEGLLPVLPFINLKPGFWQVSCSGQASEETEPQIVRFQVLPAASVKPSPEVAPAAIATLPQLPSLEPPQREPEATAPLELTSEPQEAVRATVLSDGRLEEQPPGQDLESLLERSIQSLEQILAAANEPVAKAAPPEPPPQKVAAEVGFPEALTALQLRLALYHENFVRHPGESLLISGQVDAIDPSQNDLEPIFAALEGRSVQLVLRYLLRDPQTPAPGESNKETDAAGIQILFDSQQSAASTALPKVFGYRLEVPERDRHPLILGEVRLEAVLGAALQTTRILARSSFTITAAVDELLEAVVPSPLEVDRSSAQLPELEESAPSVRAEFLEIAKQAVQNPSFSPTFGQVLPPKLSASTGSKTARSLDLPDFPLPSPSVPETPEPAAESPVPPSETESTPEEAPPIAPSPPALTPEFSPIDDLLPPLPPDEVESEPPLEPNVSEPPPEPTESEQAFQALHLEDRFWSRMNSLMEEAASFAADNPSPLPPEAPPKADLLGSTSPVPPPETPPDDGNNGDEGKPSQISPDVETPFDDDPWANLLLDESPLTEETPIAKPEPSLEKRPPAPVATEETIDWGQPEAEAMDWGQNEFVVDDDDEMPPPELFKRDTSGLPYPVAVDRSPDKSQNQPKVKSKPEEPIPVPILELSESELVAGETALVWVKLPPCSNSIYVKLWVIDCQTRSLLDGPRAFVDFTENQDGELETITQLLVPLGSLEIRFEAIAIDLVTQRESHKTSVSRHVIPPDLPQLG